MGTLFQITLYAADEVSAKKAADAAFQRAAELDAMMTDYKPVSELMRLSAKAGQGPVSISTELMEVLDVSQKIASATDGAFDVTIGPVVRLWRLSRRTRELPPTAELATARALVDFRHLKLDPATKTATLLKSGMKLDLGGIAKGYAADRMIATLTTLGITSALVAAGGDIVASGPPPGKKAWSVAIAGGLQGATLAKLALVNAAVSTSGDVEQFVEIGGVRYAHIIDPKTGLGLTQRLAVTAIARDGTTADAMATACAVAGAKRALDFAKATPGLAVRFVEPKGTWDSVGFGEWLER